MSGASRIWSFCFSPDSKILASAGEDATVKIWDVPSGSLIHNMSEHSDEVYSVHITADGHTLASGSRNGSVKFWDVSTGELICTILLLDKKEWVVYTPDNHFDVSKNGKKFIGWTVGMNAYGPDKFWDDYHVEGLFAKVMKRQEIK